MRREWDSNPYAPFGTNGFQNRRRYPESFDLPLRICTPTQTRTENTGFGDQRDTDFTIGVFIIARTAGVEPAGPKPRFWRPLTSPMDALVCRHGLVNPRHNLFSICQ